jgi:replication-associated recombination protein RarA
MGQLCEQYRPRTWAEVIGQDKPISALLKLQKRGLAGRAYWISGKTGTGKTTIAYLLAAEVADPEFVQEYNGMDLTAAKIRDTEGEYQYSAWGKGGRVIIVNEAHRLPTGAVTQCLTACEPPRLPKHVTWIFTTTCEGEDLFGDRFDSHALLSRCMKITLSQRDLCGLFATRAKQIAEAEGLDGQPIERYRRLAKDCGNNMREMLQRIENGEMAKELTQ